MGSTRGRGGGGKISGRKKQLGSERGGAKIRTPMSQTSASSNAPSPVRLSLCLGALGVVFGDIGTSPIYTMKECLHYLPNVDRAEGVIGILSLMFWSLLFAVNFKYLAFVTRADNRGEGGIFALLALSHKSTGEGTRRGLSYATILILIGASLLYGDGIITPAISVLGAAEEVVLLVVVGDSW